MKLFACPIHCWGVTLWGFMGFDTESSLSLFLFFLAQSLCALVSAHSLWTTANGGLSMVRTTSMELK